MLHKVVKPFPYSVDGFTLVDLATGDKRDFGALAAGLVAEGWIAPVDDDAPVEFAVAIADPIEMAVAAPRRGRPKKG